MVDRLNPHLLSGAAHIDFFENTHQPADLDAGISENQQVARGKGRDVALFAFELVQKRHRLVCAHVARTVDASNECITIGQWGPARVDGRSVGSDSGTVDDL